MDGDTFLLVRKFLSEILIEKKLLIMLLVIVIISTLLSLIPPYIIGITVDRYIIPRRIEGLIPIAIIFLTIMIVSWILQVLRGYYSSMLTEKVLYNLRLKMYDKLLHAHISFYNDKHIGDLVSRIINDTSSISQAVVLGLINIVSDIITIVGVIGAMMFLDIGLTLVILITLPPMIVIARVFGTRMRRAFRSARISIGDLSTISEETFSGISAIKSFNAEKAVSERFIEASWNSVKMFVKASILASLFWSSMGLLSTLSTIIVISYGGYLVITGSLSMGIIAAFIQYVGRFTGPINDLISMYDQLQIVLASFERIYEVIEIDRIDDLSGLSKDSLNGEIVFDHVWFSYNGSEYVLKDINLVVKRGETIAIVGPSGAGKTSLVNLLLRFYEPTKGRILIDGIDITKYCRKFLRQRISYVPQETYLFTGTIMENIKAGKPEASDDEVIEICKKLGIHSFIERLPKGYYTDAGEAGKRLSAGEKQLIAIARAMLRNPDIVILDEAMSNIDAETEELIRKAIKNLMIGRTGIIVAHRLTLTKECNRIIVIDNGRIAEEGSFEELMNRRGLFYKLYMSQVGEEEKRLRDMNTYIAI
ncbi:ABC transporter related [Ignisphaera aggregans DSM 17230]|uniref:ABC transporter related n=1 Tax=Ignisphaera aggregans (strain DSM 17230 / JCM 13409 / AQ1.S1) TaxID=583356 RepID=E0SNG9_IGNAA|nr:ABC transporter related [Ignisphaera aggregans DSM 17230]